MKLEYTKFTERSLQGGKMTTKRLIHEFVINESKLFQNNDFSLLTTSVIADELHISRSLTSQYLNDLYAEGLLVKILSRPVYYLDKDVVKNRFQISTLSDDYLSIKEFFEDINSQKPKDVFESVIGHDGSLSQVINQIKSSLSYPSRGLGIILYGPQGSGKKYLVDVIGKYCKENEIIDSSQVVYYLNYIGDSSSQDKLLFGTDEEEGILENKSIGIVYVENPEGLSQKNQYKLANIIKDGYYQKKNKVIKVNCRFIFASIKEPKLVFEYSLLQSLPIICNIKNYDQRPAREKEQFIIKFFKQEQMRLNLKIHISYRLLEVLIQLKFDRDLHELEKCITRICVNALQSAKDNNLYCHVYHLPDERIANISRKVIKEAGKILTIDEYNYDENSDKLILMYDKLIVDFSKQRNGLITYDEMLKLQYETMRNYYDLLIFNTDYERDEILGLENIIDEVLSSIKSVNQINIPTNCSFVLSRMLINTTFPTKKIIRWEEKNKNDLNHLSNLLKEEMSDIYILSKEIAGLIYQQTELILNDYNLIFFIINIYFYNDEVKTKTTAAVIVSHGYSTASSIADAANHLLNEHVFDAFDMPLDSSSAEIIIKVNDYICMNPHYKNLILLVDMGSLELIAEQVTSDINIGVINNISTSIALHVGSMIQQQFELDHILKKASESAVVNYKILNRAKKEKAILFVSDAGIAVADRMVNLFKSSLPKSIDLRFLSYDFNKLLTNSENDPIFEKFDVVLMVKPYSLPIGDIRSVSLEDIVNFKEIATVDEALNEYLDRDHIETFNRNLLKNFSLQNVMQNLTILNANKLLDYVSEATLTLEKKLNKKFQSKTIVGIYIHVCFLIERLVTKTPIQSYKNVNEFEKENMVFINYVNESFGPMLEHYNVEMPLSEMALLYDYIVNDGQRITKEGDEF